MDRFIENTWFIKIMSLLLALMLFMSVNLEQKETNSDQEETDGITVVSKTEDVQDIPVQIRYSNTSAEEFNKRYILEGIPELVDVTLEGPNSLMKTTKIKREFVVFIDVGNLGEGKHRVRLEQEGIPQDLKVRINPSTINVTIKSKVMKEVTPAIEMKNEDTLSDNYEIGEVEFSPATIKVIGSKESVYKVSKVVAEVDLERARVDVEKEVPLKALDTEGEEILGLQIEPSTLKVKVPIQVPSITLEATYDLKGTLPNDARLKKIEIDPAEIQLFGPKTELDKIKNIEPLIINLSEVEGTKTVELSVPLPKGAERAEPRTVKATIEIEKRQQKTWSNVPIVLNGTNDLFIYQMLSPESMTTSIKGIGYPSDLSSVTAGSFSVECDVSDLEPGMHEVTGTIQGPPSVELESETVVVKIEIKENE